MVSINLLNKEEVLEKYPHQLSGVMLQRIMIGIAMALQPKLLIADEPTTAIDAITQYEILEEFIRIKKNKNTAMLFITHDLGAISKVADRILVMNSGRIVDSGSFRRKNNIGVHYKAPQCNKAYILIHNVLHISNILLRILLLFSYFNTKNRYNHFKHHQYSNFNNITSYKHRCS